MACKLSHQTATPSMSSNRATLTIELKDHCSGRKLCETHKDRVLFEIINRMRNTHCVSAAKIEVLPEIWVAMVSSVVTPSETRAGIAFGSSQKETHETMTSIEQGI